MDQIFIFRLPIDSASALTGGLIGLVLAFGLYLYDKSIKPKLEVKLANPSNLPLPQGNFKSLNLKIVNKRREGILQFLNKPATQLRILLYFADFPTATLMNTVIARWNSSREPLTPDYKFIDYGLALTNPREVLVPGEEGEISVAIRKEDKSYCFPFNNTSYIYQQKDFEVPGWEIDDDKFIVVVRIQSAEIDKLGGVFIVLNKSSIDQFKIDNFRGKKSYGNLIDNFRAFVSNDN